MKNPHIAFFGLGIMGSGMARRLLINKFRVTVFNRNPEKSRPFAAEGAEVATTPRTAAATADIIISMVADDHASRSVWLGEQGGLSAARPETVCIECSTLSVGWVRELASAATAQRCAFLDAPVTGSKLQAANGELNFIVGGEAAVLEKVRPVLQAMSKIISPLGPAGAGAMIKLVNNFLCGAQVAALAEAVTLIERSGLDRAAALAVLTNGAPGSPLVKTVSQRMMAPDFTPNFPLRLMTKDLAYAIVEGGKLSVDLTTAAAALKVFQAGMAGGYGDKDMAAVVEPLRKK